MDDSEKLKTIRERQDAALRRGVRLILREKPSGGFETVDCRPMPKLWDDPYFASRPHDA